MQVVKDQDQVVHRLEFKWHSNDETMCVVDESYVDTVCLLHIPPYFCYEYVKPACADSEPQKG